MELRESYLSLGGGGKEKEKRGGKETRYGERATKFILVLVACGQRQTGECLPLLCWASRVQWRPRVGPQLHAAEPQTRSGSGGEAGENRRPLGGTMNDDDAMKNDGTRSAAKGDKPVS